MSSSTSTHPDLAAVESASNETAMILAACHSLVVVEEDEAQDGEDRAVNLVGRLGCRLSCAHFIVLLYVCVDRGSHRSSGDPRHRLELGWASLSGHS